MGGAEGARREWPTFVVAQSTTPCGSSTQRQAPSAGHPLAIHRLFIRYAIGYSISNSGFAIGYSILNTYRVSTANILKGKNVLAYRTSLIAYGIAYGIAYE